jgi:hypothetical protein
LDCHPEFFAEEGDLLAVRQGGCLVDGHVSFNGLHPGYLSAEMDRMGKTTLSV